MHVLTFFAHDDRVVIAGHLRRARRYLRDKVDEIDLQAMGYTRDLSGDQSVFNQLTAPTRFGPQVRRI